MTLLMKPTRVEIEEVSGDMRQIVVEAHTLVRGRTLSSWLDQLGGYEGEVTQPTTADASAYHSNPAVTGILMPRGFRCPSSPTSKRDHASKDIPHHSRSRVHRLPDLGLISCIQLIATWRGCSQCSLRLE